MALESEIKLSLPPGWARFLIQHPLLSACVPVRKKLINVYYDTPALDLHGRRVAIRHRRQGNTWLLTVKSAASAAGGLAQRNEWEVECLPGAFDFSHVEDSPLRQQLNALRKRLTPIFTTDFSRTAWLLELEQGCVEIALDRGLIEVEGRKERICELEIELIRGEVSTLFATARRLQQDIPLHPEVASKAERGYRLYTNVADAACKAKAATIKASDSPIKAFRSIALSCLVQLQGNEQGIRNNNAPEFVHQARVAIRRLRTALRIWRPLLPDSFREFDKDWRALAITLGEARNRDVFLQEILPPYAETFSAPHGLKSLQGRSTNFSKQARKTARNALSTPEYARLLLDFTAALLALDEKGNKGDPLPVFCRRSLKRRARRIALLAPDKTGFRKEMLHPLRIALKRLRYTLEFFSDFYPGKTYQNYHRRVCHLLDLLGQWNDHVVARHMNVGNARLDGWLAGRSELLLQQLPSLFEAFKNVPAPWKHR